LSTGTQHEEDPVHHLAIGHPRTTSTEAMGIHMLRDKRSDPLPHLVRNREDPRHRPVTRAHRDYTITTSLN
jgi:hypothetical protein